MFFSDWHSLFRILVVGVLAYAVLIVFLRVSGKRTLSKMNAFDFVVTVSLGSTLATVLLSKDVTLAEGALRLATEGAARANIEQLLLAISELELNSVRSP